MKKWLKRIRGAVGMGLTWAAGWGVVGAVVGLVTLAMGTPALGGMGLVGGALMWTVVGFVGGALFSTVLGITEGRRTFHEMSLPRFAAWGAAGAGAGLLTMLFLGIWGPLTLTGVLVGVVMTLMGAGSAAGSLALARKAHDGDLLEAGESAGLIEGE